MRDKLHERISAMVTWQIENGEPWPGYNSTLAKLLDVLQSLVESQCDIDGEHVTQGGNQAARAVNEAVWLMLDEAGPFVPADEVPW